MKLTSMMAKGWFAQFNLWVLLCFCSCATAELKPPEAGFRAELSSLEVASGAIALVTVHLNHVGDRTLPLIGSSERIVGDFEGIELPFYADTVAGETVYRSILGVPYERKPGPAALSIHLEKTGPQTQPGPVLRLPFNVVDGNYRSEVLHVDGRRVNPTRKTDLIRIQKEQAEVLEIYSRVTPQKLWTGPFQLPIQSRVTSPYGTKRLYNGKLKNFHTGLDLRAPMKTPIFSPAPGKVVLAKSLFYTGNTVMIDHGYGLITLYAHMSRLKVKEGDVVNTHDLLGLSGKTGRVNGPHLHWQAVVHRVKVNPVGLTQVVQ